MRRWPRGEGFLDVRHTVDRDFADGLWATTAIGVSDDSNADSIIGKASILLDNGVAGAPVEQGLCGGWPCGAVHAMAPVPSARRGGPETPSYEAHGTAPSSRDGGWRAHLYWRNRQKPPKRAYDVTCNAKSTCIT